MALIVGDYGGVVVQWSVHVGVEWSDGGKFKWEWDIDEEGKFTAKTEETVSVDLEVEKIFVKKIITISAGKKSMTLVFSLNLFTSFDIIV